MIVELPDTTTSKVSKEIVAMRERGGVVTLGRVLTLVVDTQPDFIEEAIAAANEASREHPCRIIVLAEGSHDEETRLDAEIRFKSLPDVRNLRRPPDKNDLGYGGVR